MNKFSDFNIESSYSTDDDVVSFYNKILSCSKTYDRVSAYFTFGFFNYISKGLSNFITNGGTIRMVLSTQVDLKTLSEMRAGLEMREQNPNEYLNITKMAKINFSELDEDVSILAYLIATNKLEVKFAFKGFGIEHQKYAIVEDFYGNKLLTIGSNNSTEAAVGLNKESFAINCNWDEPGKRELNNIVKYSKEFEKYWENDVDGFVVVPLPEFLKTELINKIDNKVFGENASERAFVRISIDELKVIRVQSNVPLLKIMSQYRFKLLKGLIETSTEYLIVFKPLEAIKDIVYVKDLIELLCKENNLPLIISNELSKFLDKFFFDLTELSSLGKTLKSDTFLSSSTDFRSFCDETNKLVMRKLTIPQLKASYHIVKMRRSMNFSVPGSGKTASVLGAFQFLKKSQYIKRIVVIGPLNCFKSWKDEYKTVIGIEPSEEATTIIDIHSLETIQVQSTVLRYDFSKASLILINFDILPKIANFLEPLIDGDSMIVFDEIHRIKNYQSAKSPAAKKIVRNAKYRVALTGTPLPNGYKDLLNMFSLLFDEYTTEYFSMDADSLSKADKSFEETGIESSKINDLIYPFYVRLTKEDLDVPPANDDNLVRIITSDDEKNLYAKVINEQGGSFSKIVRLTEIACIPGRVEKGLDDDETEKEFSDDDYEIYNDHIFDKLGFCDNKMTSKISKFLEMSKAIDSKAIVWCLYTDTIKKVAHLLSERGDTVAIIYGNTPIEERSDIIDRFNNSDEIKYLVTNPNTMAESVSLHKKCHTAYYLEINYNLAQFLQSKDRIHRLGLPEGTKTNYYIFMNEYGEGKYASIDEVIYRRLMVKNRRMMRAIEKGNFFVDNKVDPKEYDEILEELKGGTNK